MFTFIMFRKKMTFVIRTISICRNKDGLGFILSGQDPCIVSSITQNGPADNATLRAGDEILEVDFLDVAHLKREEVVKHILSDKNGKVILNVRTFISPKDADMTITKDNNSVKNVTGKSKHVIKSCQDIPDYPANGISSESHRSNDKKLSNLSKRRVIKADKATSVDTECQSNIETYNTCPLTYLPGIFGVESQHNQINETKHTKHFGKSNHVYNAIVYYKCSKEIPKVTNLQASSLDTLRSCVLILKEKDENPSALVLLTINEKGVKISSPSGKEIITYPLKTIVFSAVCSDNRNYFGFVTKNIISNSYSTGLTLPQNSPSSGCSPLSFCHVFMIDPGLCDHDAHHTVSALFNFTCVLSSEQEVCQQFPKSSSVILKELNSFYDKRLVGLRNSYLK